MNVRLKLSLVAVLAAYLVLGPAQMASAHYIYELEQVYDDGDPALVGSICLDGRSEISHGSGGGYSKADAYAKYDNSLTTASCLAALYVGAGNLAVKNILYKWTGSSWVVCRETAWKYNSSEDWKLTQSKNWGTSPPCGNAYYGNSGAAFIWDNGAWRGGWVWSGGSHWLPA